MKTKEVLAIILKTAKAYPRTDDFKINGFAFIRKKEDVQHKTAGKTFNEYLKGEFWAHNWELRGASSSDMEHEMNMVFVHRDSLTIPIRDKFNYCETLTIGIVGTTNCLDCKDDKPTILEVESRLQVALQQLIFEIQQNKAFTTQNGIVWATEQEMQLSGTPFTHSKSIKIEFMDATINTWSDFLPDNQIAVFTTFQICDCNAPVIFNYQSPEPTQPVGVPYCSTC